MWTSRSAEHSHGLYVSFILEAGGRSCAERPKWTHMRHANKSLIWQGIPLSQLLSWIIFFVNYTYINIIALLLLLLLHLTFLSPSLLKWLLYSLPCNITEYKTLAVYAELSLFGDQIFCGSTWILSGGKGAKMALLTLKVADPWPRPSLWRATILILKSSESSLPWGAMLNIQWSVWENCTQRTKF